ncbi:lysine--tRNA ligase [Megasphaera hutchinsoni]|uniref:Lysine--tRNA ligase n=1 Tax=Megasphaera hutchinsoni TaxID=1588748 RepID=A0A2J8BAW6_9FIRM|nr:lysine--tRNA ligase [Megasphaera genomosp. type_2]PNH21907.1 lysine--tRNA ligase [Megasphaera genomosp. type_2]
MADTKQTEQTTQDIEKVNDQMQVRRDKMQQFIDAGMYPFGEKYEWDHHTQDVKQAAEALEKEETPVRVAGRLMALRRHGKTAFCVLRDISGEIQLYFRKDILGEASYDLFKLLDIGDIIGVEGTVFTTHTGETTIRVLGWTLLSKALRPLPEKFHGLTDKETRYRQRYVDLIVNPEVKDTFIKRAKIIKGIRHYLEEKQFLEVETPMLHTIAGGAAARPFKTYHNALDMEMYLRIAPELHLKRLIVGGLERVYELNRCFRNEGIDTRHNPEFTTVELYQAYGDLEDVIAITENLVAELARSLYGTTKITYMDTEIDLTPSWNRMTMVEAIAHYTGEDFTGVTDVTAARAIADKLHVPYTDFDGVGKIINACFEEYVEEKLIQPTIITGHPLEISPLTKQQRDNPLFTYRFEAFVYGRELANGFSELNDPLDQRNRFLAQMEERERGDDEAHQMDEDYCRALEYGLPPTGGLGIGIDRLVMLLTNSASIRDVLLFPTMKPTER